MIATLLATLILTTIPDVSFSAGTLPSATSLKTSVQTVREGDEWKIDVTVKNTGRKKATFKLFLAAEPHFQATNYLFPGINYNGNTPGRNTPVGLEKDGEPWIFAYDRGSIPSCTISENEGHVFALFASDGDPLSHESSCSMEKLGDGSFRHLIYWPVTEAPLTYSNKLEFTERYDTYLTLEPGKELTVSAFASQGTPLWPEYGFTAVFPVAWKRLHHDVKSQHTVNEVLRLDKAYQDWGRCQDDEGYWYGAILHDEIFKAGYSGNGISPDGHTIKEYSDNPSLNHWVSDELEQSKNLKEGEYVKSPGRDIGFSNQSFQLARLSIEYGFRNSSPKDIDFGLKVLRSWISVRQLPSGLFKSFEPLDPFVRDASTLGFAIGELSRVAALLRDHGMEKEAGEFRESARKVVEVVLSGVKADGNPGSAWYGDTGKVSSYYGDGGGFVLMGLARYWRLTGDERIVPVIDKALEYYYKTDINHFRCPGGAMDCASIDREGIHPFFTTAMILYQDTGNVKYLEYARKAAWYFASWLYLQNPYYGPDTDFSIYNWKPAGSTIVGTEHPALDDYGCVLIGEYINLSRIDGNPLWKEVALLMWRNATQGFADENRLIWHGLERPVGAKNEAYFPSRWSKYVPVDKARGSLNNCLVSWGGVYRAACIYDLSPQDLLWLDENSRP